MSDFTHKMHCKSRYIYTQKCVVNLMYIPKKYIVNLNVYNTTSHELPGPWKGGQLGKQLQPTEHAGDLAC